MSPPEEKHFMRREAEHPGGWEEYYCPRCGRRFIMRWPPNYAKRTLVEGDPYAIHYYSTDGLDLTGYNEEQAEDDQAEDIQPIDPYLRPFEDFLSSLGDNPSP